MSECELEDARGENFRPPAAASTAQQLLYCRSKDV